MLFGYQSAPGWRGAMDEVDRLRRDFDRLLSGRLFGGEAQAPSGLYPLINLSETPEAYHLSAELPGVAPEDIEINVTGRNLTISGKRGEPDLEEGARYHRRERGSAGFSRALGLPAEVDTSQVQAKTDGGVLYVTLPKSQAAKARRIQVSAS